MIKAIRIALLKQKARSEYKEYCKAMDTVSCGHALAVTISSRVSHAVVRFNKMMDKLATLDPNSPKVRL